MVIKMNVGGEHLWGGLWGYDLSSPESRCTCHQYHRHNNQMVKMKIFYQRSESAPKIFRFSLQSMKSLGRPLHAARFLSFFFRKSN